MRPGGWSKSFYLNLDSVPHAESWRRAARVLPVRLCLEASPGRASEHVCPLQVKALGHASHPAPSPGTSSGAA